MNIPDLALKNLRRKLTRTWLLLAIVAVVSCTLFTATLALKSVDNAVTIGAQRLGAARALMVIDRGTTAGAERGQRITVFRRALGDRGSKTAGMIEVRM